MLYELYLGWMTEFKISCARGNLEALVHITFGVCFHPRIKLNHTPFRKLYFLKGLRVAKPHMVGHRLKIIGFANMLKQNGVFAIPFIVPLFAHSGKYCSESFSYTCLCSQFLSHGVKIDKQFR